MRLSEECEDRRGHLILRSAKAYLTVGETHHRYLNRMTTLQQFWSQPE